MKLNISKEKGWKGLECWGNYPEPIQKWLRENTTRPHNPYNEISELKEEIKKLQKLVEDLKPRKGNIDLGPG